MPQQNQQVLAYLLHSKPYQENSLIIQLFSLELGCFSVIAKGIKAKKSQARKAILQPFLELAVEFTGKSDLKTLIHCELNQKNTYTASQSPLLSLQGKSLACGYYANELILRACPQGHEYPELFYHYQQFINNLKSDIKLLAKPIQTILRDFEVSLLTAIGIAPDWFYDTNQLPIESDKEYLVLAESGFQLAEPVADYNADYKNEVASSLTSSLNNSRYQGHSILSLATGDHLPEYFKSYQQITAILLRQVIGNKPLQSRKLWQHLNLTQ